MNYQDLFQSLKGVGEIDLQPLVLPIPDANFALFPINCRPGAVEQAIIEMLTEGRNDNSNSFLTYFAATPQRTEVWLTNLVATDKSRILFALKDLDTGTLYGYMGLACADDDGLRIEVDAIVRSSGDKVPGLMRIAFLRLVEWARKSLFFGEIWVRVLTDNPAIWFYTQCNFISQYEVPLHEIRNSDGNLTSLAESATPNSTLSNRSLTYMKFVPRD